jgi:hypothetical protein
VHSKSALFGSEDMITDTDSRVDLSGNAAGVILFNTEFTKAEHRLANGVSGVIAKAVAAASGLVNPVQLHVV